MQEALIAAMTQWPDEGIPADPRAWLMAVARRRIIDHIRSSAARRNREMIQLEDLTLAVDPFVAARPGRVDTLGTLLLCADPLPSRTSQVALTLRIVAGLTTAQIAPRTAKTWPQDQTGGEL